MHLLRALICCLLLPAAAPAQLQLNSLQDMLSYADKNSPAIRQAQIQPLSARQDVHIQASGLYPRVNGFATGDYYPVIATQVIPAEFLGGQPGTYLKAQFGLPYVFTVGGELSIPVVNLEKWAQLKRSRAQYEQAQWNSKAAIENVHIQLIQGYYQWLVSRELLQLNDENTVVANELIRIMQQRNEAGVIDPADYNRSRNLQLDVLSANINSARMLQQSVNSLEALLNVDTLAIGDSLGRFSWPVLSSAAGIDGRAGWQEVNARLKVAELSLKENRVGGLPRLALNSRYAYNMQSRLETGSNNVEFDVANVGMRLDVPLFQGNYYRAMKKKSSLQLASARLEQQRIQANLTQQQQDWYEQYSAAYNKHEVLKDKLAAAKDNLRIAQLNLGEGVMEFDQFNNIFIEYNRARIEYIQNLADGVLYHLLSTQNF